MPFKDPNASVLFPIHKIETDLTSRVRKHLKCPMGETDMLVMFLFEVWELFCDEKLNPDIAFIHIFKKWCRRYSRRPMVLKEIEFHSDIIIDYLIAHSRELEHLDGEEKKIFNWANELKAFVHQQVCLAIEGCKPVHLTK